VTIHHNISLLTKLLLLALSLLEALGSLAALKSGDRMPMRSTGTSYGGRVAIPGVQGPRGERGEGGGGGRGGGPTGA
jgi:hypothetical protein